MMLTPSAKTIVHIQATTVGENEPPQTVALHGFATAMAGMGRDALSIRVAERRELTGEKGETEPTVVNAAVDDIVVSVVDGYLAYTVGRHRNTVAGPRLERDKFPAVEAVEAVPRRKPYKSVLVLENLSHMAVGEPIVLTINYGPVRLRNTYGCCGQTNDCYRHCPSHCVEFLCSLSVIVFAFYWLNFPFCAPTFYIRPMLPSWLLPFSMLSGR